MINSVVMEGRLVNAPELSKMKNGESAVTIRIACDDRPRKDGEKRTIFIDVNAFGFAADFAAKYFKKGSHIATIGKLIQRKYTRKSDGLEIEKVEIVADRFEFMSKGQEGNQVQAQAIDKTAPRTKEEQYPGSQNLSEFDVTDDDLPF